MPTIFDNIDNKLADGLNKTLKNVSRADFCIGYFNLRGWNTVIDKIDNLEGSYLPEEYDDDEFYYCRVLIGMQKAPEEEIRELLEQKDGFSIDNSRAGVIKKKIALQFKEQLTIGSPTNSDEKNLIKLTKQLKSRKVIVKLHLKHTLHAKLYLVHRKNDYNLPSIGFVGSSNLTFSGLQQQGELNVDVVEGDAAKKLADWYQDRWEDRWSIDITKELAEIIENSWATEKLISPYHIYLKIAYHLSSEARAGITEFSVSDIFQKKLLPFQKNAVQIAAHHLHKRGGAMVGDVVGLGKTLTAVALAKMFQDDFGYRVLIICPPRLIEMWEDESEKYFLTARIVSLASVRGVLPELRGRYHLVIIDESHNLRNSQGKRYKAIHEYISLNECKVMMLTATPYNKTYKDLSSQLKLFLSDDYNLGITPEKYIESLDGLVHFQAKHQVSEYSVSAFEHSSFSDDWNELMRLFLVRRTRSFIKSNYADEDLENGRKYLTFDDGTRSYFPDRVPKKVEYKFDRNDKNDQYAKLYSEDVVKIIDSLTLPRYGLGHKKYEANTLETALTSDEVNVKDNLSKAGTRLIGFARTNLFKRLESSGFSFLQSVTRHILRNYLFVYAIDNNMKLPIGQQEAGLIDDFMYSDDDLEQNQNNQDNEPKDEKKSKNSKRKESADKLLLKEVDYLKSAEKYYKKLLNQKQKYDWIRTEIFNDELKEDLINDSRALLKVLKKGKDWKTQDDRQLSAIEKLINKTHKKEKILIFTQYSDTAYYLFDALKDKVDSLDVVTGGMFEPTDYAYRFSPVSNDKNIEPENQIRVLISTDVLSEGQNLQDAHIVINYDLPWAIIRLIQRAGRVDRIGQKHDEILVYSLLPEKGVEDIIKLRKRLKQRIEENAEAVGSDEVFFDGDPVNIRDLYNEKAGILDDEEDVEVDLSSYAYQIWKNAIEKDKKMEKIIPEMPDVVYATKNNKTLQNKNSAIVYTKTSQENNSLVWLDDEGKIITQSQFEILKTAKCEPDETPLERFEKHHQTVRKGLEFIHQNEKKIGGQLGNKRSVRYRAYNRLEAYFDDNKNTLFENQELLKAIQDIYDYPLKEYARDTISRQLKSGINDNELAALVISLKETDRLSMININDNKFTEPKIICSMGLKED